MAQDLVVGLFPALLIDPVTVDAADTWLRTADPDPTLRRLIVEGRDGLARALRARGCDATAASR
jgi:aminopeptidase N